MKLTIKFLIFASFSLILYSSLINIAYSYDSFFDSPIKGEMYTKLSELINNTGNKVNQTIQAIQSGNTDEALNILSNVTNNIHEISNGFDIYASAPS